LCSPPSIIRIIKPRRTEWEGHAARIGGNIGGKARGKEANRRKKWRWVGNIKIDLAVIGCGDVDWIGLVQDRDK
jgi:hypothetical protein